ncbi:uncharacterized protein LOC143532418 [Bidens hawaiensis]|uniref:uncharacterized protein LOC143532418 n=1 Tax=Bidens hawaiensis TaxID=980011 RepID=UPI00404A0A40
MASSSSESAHNLTPVFKGEGYEFWSIRMKTLLRSKGLWEFVNQGFSEEDTDGARLAKNTKEDARALSLIQQGVHDSGLGREFETIQMNESEGVSEFLSKVMTIMNNKRAYGEVVSDQLVIDKVLRSLPSKWDHMVTAIEESKDLTQLSFDQLMGSLQA